MKLHRKFYLGEKFTFEVDTIKRGVIVSEWPNV